MRSCAADPRTLFKLNPEPTGTNLTKQSINDEDEQCSPTPPTILSSLSRFRAFVRSNNPVDHLHRSPFRNHGPSGRPRFEAKKECKHTSRLPGGWTSLLGGGRFLLGGGHFDRPQDGPPTCVHQRLPQIASLVESLNRALGLVRRWVYCRQTQPQHASAHFRSVPPEVDGLLQRVCTGSDPRPAPASGLPAPK